MTIFDDSCCRQLWLLVVSRAMAMRTTGFPSRHWTGFAWTPWVTPTLMVMLCSGQLLRAADSGPSISPSSNPILAPLEYQETAYPVLNLGVRVTTQTTPFKKEPPTAFGQNRSRRFEFRRRCQQFDALSLAARRGKALSWTSIAIRISPAMLPACSRAPGGDCLLPDLHERPPVFQHHFRQIPGAGGHPDYCLRFVRAGLHHPGALVLAGQTDFGRAGLAGGHRPYDAFRLLRRTASCCFVRGNNETSRSTRTMVRWPLFPFRGIFFWMAMPVNWSAPPVRKTAKPVRSLQFTE